jgi:hypothetical protein
MAGIDNNQRNDPRKNTKWLEVSVFFVLLRVGSWIVLVFQQTARAEIHTDF